jgi:23S rRNA pseudouridine2605 synthase
VPRIDKLLAVRGGYSRKIAAKMLRQGRVKVNGAVVKKSNTQCEDECDLEVDGYAIPPLKQVILFHKPAGMLSAMNDQWGRICVGDIIPPRYHMVGRLDLETRGLLLFSLDGQITQRLLHPKRKIEREYIAVVENHPTEELISIVADGVQTSVGLAQGEIVSIQEQQIKLIMREGRNRIVRRMLHNAGFSVLDLFRVRFGPFSVNGIEEGEMRAATFEECNLIH